MNLTCRSHACPARCGLGENGRIAVSQGSNREAIGPGPRRSQCGGFLRTGSPGDSMGGHLAVMGEQPGDKLPQSARRLR